MRIKTKVILSTLLFICSSFFVSASVIENDEYDGNLIVQEILEGGYVEEIDGVTVLHVSGSYYEMGFQYGYLLRNKICRNLRIYYNFLYEYGSPFDVYLGLWEKAKHNLPHQIIDEFQGFADGSGLTLEYVAIPHVVILDGACSLISVTGSATSDGKLYFARSWESDCPIFDPNTGEFLDEQVLIVREPDDGYASMYATYICWLFNHGGINEKGMSVAHAWSGSYDENFEGFGPEFRIKLLLDKASNITQALDIINSNRTIGYNILLSDSKTNESLVIEQTSNLSYIGTWDDPVESTKPCYKIDNVLRRTNFFINKTLASTQRYFYNPKSICNLVPLLLPKNRYHDIYPLPTLSWMSYIAQSRSLQKKWGSFNLYNLMNTMRDVFNGKNSLFFKINKLTKNSYGNHIYGYHQWVACPETGDMLICFHKGKSSSYEQPVYFFNLFNLLQS